MILTNGLIKQWGYIKQAEIGEWDRTINGLIAYTNTNFLALTCGHTVYDAREYCASGRALSNTSISCHYFRCQNPWWFTLGV